MSKARIYKETWLVREDESHVLLKSHLWWKLPKWMKWLYRPENQ